MKFVEKDMGKIKNYIDIDIDMDENRGKMTLRQEKYINSLIENYNLENAKLYETPVKENRKLEKSEEIDQTI